MIHFNVGDMPSCRHCTCMPLWCSSQVTGQFEFVTFVFNSMLFNSMTVVGEISPAIQNYRIDLTFVNHVLFIVISLTYQKTQTVTNAYTLMTQAYII